jgi:hypothetical protein
MSRIINPNSGGKDRKFLAKGIVLAIRELSRQDGTGIESRDMAAFISLALGTISESIEASVVPWEKRGYWVKADKFRIEWAWCKKYAEEFAQALLDDDWGIIAQLFALTAQKLSDITVSDGHRLGQPWVGAWNELNAKELKRKTPGNFHPGVTETDN